MAHSISQQGLKKKKLPQGDFKSFGICDATLRVTLIFTITDKRLHDNNLKSKNAYEWLDLNERITTFFSEKLINKKTSVNPFTRYVKHEGISSSI